MACVVYCVSSPSGKRYVGYTSRSPRARWAQHVRDAASGSAAPLHRAIRKYGAPAFRHAVLAEPSTISAARALEVQWIAWLDTAGPDGYNATTGGDGCPGYVKSQATRDKLRAALIGRAKTAEHRARLADALRGRKLSPEHAAKLAHAARNQSAATRAKIGAAATARVRSDAETAHASALGKSWLGKRRGPASEESKRAARERHAARTDEERAAISAKLRAAHAQRPRRAQTEETKAKLRAANAGKRLSAEHRARIAAGLRARHATVSMIQDGLHPKDMSQ